MGRVLADADFLGRFIVMGVLAESYVCLELSRRVASIDPARPRYSLRAEYYPVLRSSMSHWSREWERRCELVRKAVAPHLMQGGRRDEIQSAANAAAHADPVIMTQAAVDAIVLEEVAWWLRQGYRARKPSVTRRSA